ncbi:MAG: JAB domain-containing protein [Burkholderiales bacterium]
MQWARAFGPIASPADVYRLLGESASREDREIAYVVLLDVHGYCRGVGKVATGSRDHVAVDLPDVLRYAVVAGARYLVLVHNHPSGSAVPSDDDAALTQSVERAAYETGLLLLDHVVLGSREWFSFRERALFRLDKAGQVVRLAA